MSSPDLLKQTLNGLQVRNLELYLFLLRQASVSDDWSDFADADIFMDNMNW